MAPKVYKQPHENLLLEVTPITVFMIFVGENLQANVAQKLFYPVWGIRGKILHTPKDLPAPTPMVGLYLTKYNKVFVNILSFHH